jgi:hypothetical protein
MEPGQDEYEAWLQWITPQGEPLQPAWADLPQSDRDYWVMVERENADP